MPTISGITVNSGSDAVTNLSCSSGDVPSSFQERAFVDAVDLEDDPLAMIADQKKKEESEREEEGC